MMESVYPEIKVKKIVFKFGKNRESATDSSEQEDSPATSQENNREKQHCDSLQLYEPRTNHNFDKPCMIAPLPIPFSGERNSRASLVLTGSACKGGTVPPIGAVDIGVSKSAYYFRIALPGVKNDPGQVSCEIEQNGKVHIRGVTSTGGETVSRYSRIYKMIFQHQRPPGPFTISFSLPGPVDARLCALNFRSDGIFEAGVAKFEQ
ncbi:hypothetical protein Leryth_002825 [Lithospermum erythrorhizon]|uniref:SHSP domain-containing protein n=1 Tax=Lithospermum erythrorhizon TaxID=34254 RepID=A0AAV3P736_LITER|nr:hypothetical protein Leryth_002825 [Lithospermum erythrorhizon]